MTFFGFWDSSFVLLGKRDFLSYFSKIIIKKIALPISKGKEKGGTARGYLRFTPGGTVKMISRRNPKQDEYYMRQALKVAQSALQVGEVPVGCVIVLRKPNDRDEKEEDSVEEEDSSVIVSHGANQVNATRDATRHAECIAIDRMLFGGTRDRNRLPQSVVCPPVAGPTGDASFPSSDDNDYDDKWVNVAQDPHHWKNTYGWGSGRTYTSDIFPHCDLYVTCEPCIMVSFLTRKNNSLCLA